MRRLHLLEIHDQAWCPASLRDALTDNLQFYLDLGNHYGVVAPLVRTALARTGARRVVDLCSGGGGPWRRLHEALGGATVVLTDKYPNRVALERVAARTGGRIEFSLASVDALRVPPELAGFRTLFTSFHHFPPPEARAILEDAVRARQGIGVFEVNARRWIALLTAVLVPVLVLLSAPFIRPFRWSRIVWTYLVPALPLVATVDAVVSCLRTYTPGELRDLAAGTAGSSYDWEAGELSTRFSPVPITYLLGTPK